MSFDIHSSDGSFLLSWGHSSPKGRGERPGTEKFPFMTPLPTVRPISPFPLESSSDGEPTRYLLRDPADLAADQLVVTWPALCLAELADGTRNLDQILAEFARVTGREMPRSLAQQLFERLDEVYLLDNARSRQRLAEVCPRPYRLAGSGYPEAREELLPFLDDLLGVDQPERGGEWPLASILPHIDFFRGREAYRAGYASLRGALAGLRGRPLTVVVLGIAHAPTRVPCVLTRKDFATPLGPVPTNQLLVEQLAASLPFDPFLDEYHHLGEHSVEFHAVLLRRLFADDPGLSIVPLLCGSFHEALLAGTSPKELPGVSEFLQALRNLREQHRDVHFLASVDLAHRGAQFDQAPLDRDQLEELAVQDRQTLECVKQGDAEGFFRSLQADRGFRNYCGTPAIYSVLDLFPQGFELHRYQQCTEPDRSSTVTVCSATLSAARSEAPSTRTASAVEVHHRVAAG